MRKNAPSLNGLMRENAPAIAKWAIVALLALVAGYVALANALANVGAAKALPLVPKGIGQNLDAMLAPADVRLFSDLQNPETRGAKTAAMDVLRQQPISHEALRTLAYAHALDGDSRAGDEFMGLSLQASRRDLLAQIYAAGRADEAGRIEDAMQHFDTAMRVSSIGPTLVTPLLARQLPKEEYQRSFARYIASDTLWLSEFVDRYLQMNADAAPLAKALVIAKGLPSDQRFDGHRSQLLATLVVQNHLLLARQLYLASPGGQKSVIESVAVNPASLNRALAPITWILIRSAMVNASAIPLSGQGDPNAIQLTVDTSSPTMALQKIVYLRPGRYRWSSSASVQAAPVPIVVDWQVQCLVEGAGGLAPKSHRFEFSTDRELAFDFDVGRCDAVSFNAYVAGDQGQFTLSKIGIDRHGK